MPSQDWAVARRRSSLPTFFDPALAVAQGPIASSAQQVVRGPRDSTTETLRAGRGFDARTIEVGGGDRTQLCIGQRLPEAATALNQRRGIRPTVAGKNKWARIETLQRNAAFLVVGVWWD